jgi:molecular chaperone DnaJ
MPNKDFYAVLGVQKSANADEIKKSFRRLAHEHHPDKGGDPQKFKDVNEAYQVLGDEQKRKTYDQFGSAAFDPNSGFNQQQGGPGFGGFNVNMNDFGDLGEMFGDMFGFGGSRPRGPKRGNDIETEVIIDFLESVKGVDKTIHLYKNDACEKCQGSGGEPGAAIESCKTCNGNGSVEQAVRTIFGSIKTKVACTECRGTGSRPSKLCTTCKGLGIERKNKELRIPIPAGIDDGEAIRITGAGEFPGVGGKAGDLYVRIRVKSHPLFSRDGDTVYSTMRIPYSTLSLGGNIQVDTVDGEGSLVVPEATEPGTVFKIRGKGMSRPHSSSRGDHLITLQADVPRKLNNEQRDILKKLRDSGL